MKASVFGGGVIFLSLDFMFHKEKIVQFFVQFSLRILS